ncbi:hypothetical protein ACFL1U_02195 [Patescibacteria group bacterium]
MRYLWIILAIIAGILITWKADLINQSMGAPSFADKLGGGTSFYRILGVVAILGALVFLAGIF